jgi:hypothetical protein
MGVISVGVFVPYMLHTGNNEITLLTECESLMKKVLFGNAVLTTVMSERKYDFKLEKLQLFDRKQYTYFGFSKQSLLSECNVVRDLSIGKIYHQIILLNVGHNIFKKLAVFCTGRELEDRAFHKKMLIEYS